MPSSEGISLEDIRKSETKTINVVELHCKGTQGFSVGKSDKNFPEIIEKMAKGINAAEEILTQILERERSSEEDHSPKTIREMDFLGIYGNDIVLLSEKLGGVSDDFVFAIDITPLSEENGRRLREGDFSSNDFSIPSAIADQVDPSDNNSPPTP